MSFCERKEQIMKIKVDKLTYKEFSEYADATIAKPIKMTLAFFIGVAIILIIIAMSNPSFEGAVTPLFWCVGILAFLLVASNASVNTAFRKSGLATTACSYTFMEDGMKIAMGKLKGDLEWKYVKYVKETKNLWIMRVPNSQFIIPKRCMKEEEWESLINTYIPEDKIKHMRYKRRTPERTTDDDSED